MKNPFHKRSQGVPTTVSPFVFNKKGTLIPNELVSVQTALHNVDVFSVVNRISTDIASAEIEVPEPFHTILNEHPNDLMNPYTFWSSIVASMCLSGNTFVTIRRSKGVVKYLELINPADVDITLDDYARDLTYTVHYQDERDDKQFKSADMLHFKLLSAGDSYNKYTGISPLNSLADPINIQNYSNRLTLATLKNGLSPTTLLSMQTPKPLNDDAKEAIRDSFESQNIGNNSGRVVVTDQSAQLSQLSINSDVASFLNNINVSRSVISEAFGVPDGLLNGKSDAQSSVLMERSVYASSLNKYCKPIESELTYKLGIECKLDINGALDVDHQGLITNLNKLTGNLQVISTTQAQQALIKHGVLIDGIDLPPENTGTTKGGETQTQNDSQNN